MELPVIRLKQIGFIRCGDWYVIDGKLTFFLSKHQCDSHIIYAFISDDEVFYIGHSTRTLHLRMTGYKNPGQRENGQRTDMRCNKYIKEILDKGRKVDIYVLKHEDCFIDVGEFRVNYTLCLEQCLIGSIKPKWNSLGK